MPMNCIDADRCRNIMHRFTAASAAGDDSADSDDDDDDGGDLLVIDVIVCLCFCSLAG